GDIIRAYGGRKIAKVRDLPRMVANTAIGKEVAVSILRDGTAKTVKVTVGRKPGDQDMAGAVNGEGSPDNSGRFGMMLANISPEARQKLGLEENVTGALVTQVRQGSPAAREGIRPGDVIVSVDNKKVSNAQDAASALKSASRNGGKPALLRINRGGDFLYIAMKA
ncbi:MAG TPA: PDZ domain-containing protein, partial [Alphaproteobacteria bacterium]|nr:PDZ domain-containing protein [Alphaproteobacteria bacterium]